MQTTDILSLLSQSSGLHSALVQANTNVSDVFYSTLNTTPSILSNSSVIISVMQSEQINNETINETINILNSMGLLNA